METKRVVHKFSTKPFQVITPEKGSAMIVLAPERTLDLNNFSGVRAKFVSLEEGILTMETKTEKINLYNFEITFGKNLTEQYALF